MAGAALLPLPSARRAASGFTLIELLVTLAILAVLALAAVPLTVDWVHSARTLEARGLLLQGYAAAKAVALRNPCAAPADDGAAALQASPDGTTVTLRVTADECSYLQDHPNRQWSAPLPGGVALTLDGTLLDADSTPLTLELNNRGLPDATSATFTLSRGGSQNDETGTLY